MQIDSRKHEILYFCDESSHVTDEWMAVGGLAVTKASVGQISRDLYDIKSHYGKRSEVKWSNAKSRDGKVHKEYIDYLFDLVDERKAQFHIRFAPFTQYDHALSGVRKRTDTVSKMYYQLILHRAIKYNWRKCFVHVIPDDGECTNDLPNKIGALQTDEAHKFSGTYDSCLTAITPRASNSEPLLQLLDVTLGGLTSVRNNRHADGQTGSVKKGLAEYALTRSGIRDIGANSPMKDTCLSVWNVIPLGAVKARGAAPGAIPEGQAER